MKKKIFLLSALCLLEVQWSMAQAPKWVDKAKRAVFSVITYGENDKILNTGNGFFVTEDGVALSDCSLFEGAQRAVVVNSEGVQMPVVSIMGANDMYDVIKFRVGISTKKSRHCIRQPRLRLWAPMCTSCLIPHRKTVPILPDK